MNLEDKFLEIIERKHKELNLGKDYNQKFSKIKDFEAKLGKNVKSKAE